MRNLLADVHAGRTDDRVERNRAQEVEWIVLGTKQRVASAREGADRIVGGWLPRQKSPQRRMRPCPASLFVPEWYATDLGAKLDARKNVVSNVILRDLPL